MDWVWLGKNRGLCSARIWKKIFSMLYTEPGRMNEKNSEFLLRSPFSCLGFLMLKKHPLDRKLSAKAACTWAVQQQGTPQACFRLRHGEISYSFPRNPFRYGGFQDWPLTREFKTTNPQHHPSLKEATECGFGKGGRWGEKGILKTYSRGLSMLIHEP